MTLHIADAEPSGIRVLLEDNPMVGPARTGPKRFWTGAEDKKLRLHYPAGGVSLCLQYLPGRSARAIYQRADRLGLRVADGRGSRKPDRMRWTATPVIDDVIRRAFQTRTEKGMVADCARMLGRPRWWVSKRAVQLGLVVPRFKEPPWSEPELAVLNEHAHKVPAALKRMLAARGFARSETAIMVKLKRLDLDRTDPDHLNANQLAGVMGVDRKTVTRWIERLGLKAKRRQATDTDDFWWIHRRDIRAFIIDNVAVIDIRKADKVWLVDLLADRRG